MKAKLLEMVAKDVCKNLEPGRPSTCFTCKSPRFQLKHTYGSLSIASSQAHRQSWE